MPLQTNKMDFDKIDDGVSATNSGESQSTTFTKGPFPFKVL